MAGSCGSGERSVRERKCRFVLGRELSEMITQPASVIHDTQLAAGMCNRIVPGRHDPAGFCLGRIPGRRDVRIGAMEDGQDFGGVVEIVPERIARATWPRKVPKGPGSGDSCSGMWLATSPLDENVTRVARGRLRMS